jgi:hypothetical protein
VRNTVPSEYHAEDDCLYCLPNAQFKYIQSTIIIRIITGVRDQEEESTQRDLRSILADPDEMAILHRFLGGSVTIGTMKGYEREWKVWTEFVARKSRRTDADPYMREQSDRTKVLMVCHLFAERHQAGKREKAATGITAAVRKHFALAMESTEWMSAEAIGVARKSCKRTSQENREYIKAGSGRARLPVWFALIEKLREDMWVNKGFGPDVIDQKMTYIAAVFAFDMAMRAGEATHVGGEAEDHTTLCEDVVIHLTDPVIHEGLSQLSLRGGSAAITDLVEPSNVRMIEICALTHKPGVINATKEIRRGSEEEEEFLEDLVSFMKHSGATSREPLFSRRAALTNGTVRHKVCRPRAVTEALKAEVVRQGLEPTLFSFHSLRKGAVTLMKALGVSREETLARGNYSRASAMIDTTYNYNSSGTGPLGAMGSGRAKVPDREDIARKVTIPYQK